MAETMVISENDAFNAAFPQRRLSRVTLELHDGRTLQSPDTEALGDPENPTNLAEVRTKFHQYADPVLGGVRAKRIAETVTSLHAGMDITQLFAVLTQPVNGSNQ